MMPPIVQPATADCLFYSIGYGGNGVSYSTQAGRRLAELVAGKENVHALPIFQGQLPGHSFALFRRIGERLLYQIYQRPDERPD
jgi:glycine/D-amino acid oxidase-like deaminating enzyme